MAVNIIRVAQPPAVAVAAALQSPAGSPLTPTNGQSTPAQKVSPLAQAVINSSQQRVEVPPWETPKGYTILDALDDLANNRRPGKKLVFMPVESHCVPWEVRNWNPETKRAFMISIGEGLQIKPVISEREVPKYCPDWQ
jgi:hypothetical protein